MIRCPQVRLISDTGEQLGYQAHRGAQRIALDKDLDLVEVAPQGQPPVCKIMDYSMSATSRTRSRRRRARSRA